jgi:hypothetical protein
MGALLLAEFTALLARADVSQTSFGRDTGVTACQGNNWTSGRASIKMGRPARGRTPGVLARGPGDRARGGGIQLARILGVPRNADTAAPRRAMTRVNATYENA